MTSIYIETERKVDPREGKLQVISNIDVCNKISEFMETTLGPYGMDKLFVNKGEIVCTNDGATILKNLNTAHPIGKLLVKISESQDKEVGDGTTSVVVLTTAILNSLKSLIKEGFCLEKMREALIETKQHCLKKLDEIKFECDEESLLKVAETSVNSKNIRGEKTHFAKILVDALKNTDLDDLTSIGIKKIPGGSISDSVLVNGIAFEKCFSYAGYEQQPKSIKDPKIICLNIELEWKAERDNAELKIDSIEEYQKVVDAEWTIIRNKLDSIIGTGANVVLSSLPIGDYATQYFAKKNIFCAGRVSKEDLKRITKEFGGVILSSLDGVVPELANASLFEERQVGKERYNYIEGSSKTASTILLRGPGEEVLNEVERSIHDAQCALRMALRHKEIITGGGSAEMQMSLYLKDMSKNCTDKKGFVYMAVSQALERIPTVLIKNFGLDVLLVIQQLRREHFMNNLHAGVSVKGMEDMKKVGIFEPLQVKKNLVKCALDTAAAIIMIDSTIISNKR